MIIKITQGNDPDLLRRDLNKLVKYLEMFNIHIPIEHFLSILVCSDDKVFVEMSVSLQKIDSMFILQQCDEEDPNSILMGYNSIALYKRKYYITKLIKYLSARL